MGTIPGKENLDASRQCRRQDMGILYTEQTRMCGIAGLIRVNGPTAPEDIAAVLFVGAP
jgi:hypothetical protein